MHIAKNKRAFTLIELLVVITIIGILATAGTNIFTNQLQKSRDTGRISDVKMYQTAANQYFSDKQGYPGKDENNGGDPASGATGTGWFKAAVGPYVSVIKQDVNAGKKNCRKQTADSVYTALDCNYAYAVWQDTSAIDFQSYKLGITFENKDNINNQALNAVDGWSGAEIADNGAYGLSNSVYEVYGGDRGYSLALSGAVARAGDYVSKVMK